MEGQELQRKLGFWAVLAISVGTTVGSGIFVSVGEVAKAAGTWKRVGWTQELLCVEQTPDGGRSCTDGAQCAARICLHDGPDNTRPNGKCPNTYGPTLGCFTQIKNGMLQPTLCVD